MHPQAARSYMTPKSGRRGANVLQQAARLGGAYEGRGAKLHPQAALGSILASTQMERERGEEHTCIHRPLWGAYLHPPKKNVRGARSVLASTGRLGSILASTQKGRERGRGA